jgi:hypothetical protein
MTPFGKNEQKKCRRFLSLFVERVTAAWSISARARDG